MNYETYTNLLRIAEKRKRVATYSAKWELVSKTCEEIERLHAEYAREISPEPAGHPDNPFRSA